MTSEDISFNDIPRVIAQIYSKLERLEEIVLQANRTKQSNNENSRILMNTDEACEFLIMPKPTLYAKLENGSIPAIKQGKRYYLYKDELEKWLETGRRNPCAKSIEEIDQKIQNSHRRKGKPINF